LRVGKVINQNKVAKHFELDMGDNRFAFARKHEAFAAEVEAREAALPVYEMTAKAAANWGPPGPATSLIKPANPGAAAKAAADADPAEPTSARAAEALVLDEALHILADFVEMLAGPSHWGG